MSAELGKHLERVDLICISYPYTVLPFLTLHKQGWHLSNLEQFAQGNNRRLLLVYGTKDQFTGTGSYERLRNRLDSNANGNATINVIDGADHFWHDRNHKDRLIQYIVDFANSQQSV
ncbi:hypothetical protein GQ42DRAFT_163316 [Ramicandelaber brevisporus]|nr:hypothetical protein GQ42DRAFT_163316 [Ramicandelaber brevisporus]